MLLYIIIIDVYFRVLVSEFSEEYSILDEVAELNWLKGLFLSNIKPSFSQPPQFILIEKAGLGWFLSLLSLLPFISKVLFHIIGLTIGSDDLEEGMWIWS